MNRTHQAALIRQQTRDIHQSPDCRIIEQDNPLELQIDMKGLGDRRYHVVFDLDDYDVEPPRLHVLDAEGRASWAPEVIPPPPVSNTSIHPIEKRPFLCVRGTRDYHSHPLHAHEPWDQLRNNLPLSRLVADLRNLLQTQYFMNINLPLNLPSDWTRIDIEVYSPTGSLGKQSLQRA